MNLEELKKQLPTGAIKDIATLSGLHWTAVHNFFKGKSLKNDVEMKLIKSTTEYLKNYKESKAEAIKELQFVANI